jgi:hypothetical protein
MVQWSNGRIIALLTLAGVLLVAYGFVQVFSKTATLPPRLVKQRSIVSALWATFCINGGNYIFSKLAHVSPHSSISQKGTPGGPMANAAVKFPVYYLPIWFQAIKGVSAVDSGIRLLPLMLSTVFGSIFGGFLNSKVGYYTPLAIVGSCIMTVGAGLLTTLQVDSGAGKWIGYQVLYGLGVGLCFQTPNLAAQTALPRKDVPVGLALMLFCTLMGSTVFVSVGENVLSNQLLDRLSGLSGFNPQLVTSGGATALVQAIAPDQRGAALAAYNEAIREVFRVGLIVTSLTVLGTFTLEWLSVKKPEGPPPAEPKPQAGLVAEPSGGSDEKKVEATN